MNVFELIKEKLENATYWTKSTFDEDGYCNDDSEEVLDINMALDIVDEVAQEYNIPIIHGKAELELHDKQIRAKAIDEFAEKMKKYYQAYDIDLCLQDNDHLSYTNSCTALESYIDEIAEQLKGGSDDE